MSQTIAYVSFLCSAAHQNTVLIFKPIFLESIKFGLIWFPTIYRIDSKMGIPNNNDRNVKTDRIYMINPMYYEGYSFLC